MKYLACLLFIPSIAYGQSNREYASNGMLVESRRVENPTWNPKPGTEVHVGWNVSSPVRDFPFDPRLGKAVCDVESQMPPNHVYRDNELPTWVHETSHGINSRLRNSLGAGYNAFYCLNGTVGVVRTPRIRKSQVGNFIPQHLRGDVFSLYVSGQGAWEDNATYILDEWTAYINGAICAKEMQHTIGNRSVAHDCKHAIEMMVYAHALLQCVLKYDPDYEDAPELADLIGYNIQRTIDVAGPVAPNEMSNALAHIAVPEITVEWRKPHEYVYEVRKLKWSRKGLQPEFTGLINENELSFVGPTPR